MKISIEATKSEIVEVTFSDIIREVNNQADALFDWSIYRKRTNYDEKLFMKLLVDWTNYEN